MSDICVHEIDLGVLNLACCQQAHLTFKVIRQHDIALILSQARQITALSSERAIAHVMYMIVRLRPFQHCNNRTALLYGVWAAEKMGLTFDTRVAAGLLKHEASVDTLAGQFAS